MADSLVTFSPGQDVSPPSLALAMKDIFYLAQALNRFLAKFPDVHGPAAEILEVVEEIKERCDQHYVALNGSDVVRNIIIGLLKDMKDVDIKVRVYLSSNPEHVNAWKDSNRMQSALVQVRNRSNKCRVQIMMFTTADTDKQVVLAEHPNTHSFTAIRHQISAWVSDEWIVALLGARPEYLSPTVSTYHIADTYIRVQIKSILERLRGSGSYAVEKPSAAYMAPYQLSPASHSMEDSAQLRQNVITKIQEVQTLTRNDPTMVSIQSGARKMVTLCNLLDYLDMTKEAASMGLWAVSLFRTLVSADSRIYSPYLSHSLQRLSYYYTRVRDFNAAEKTIQEAVVIDRRLYKHSKELEVQVQIVTALKTYSYVAALKKDKAKALEHAEEAVRLFEVLIEDNRSASHEDGPSHLHLLRTEQEWAEALADFPDQANLSYSRALVQLSFSLQDNGRAVDAVGPQVKATAVMKFMSRYYPDGALDSELARMLYRLSRQQFRNFLSLEEALDYSNEAVEIYRRLFDRDAKKYGRALCDALWEQGNILGKLGRHDTAVAVWKETARLAKEILQDRLFQANALKEVSWNFRRLKRHANAAAACTEYVKVYQTTVGASSFTEANAYYDLAVDFHFAHRYLEAIEAAQMALTRYRALAFKDPRTYTKNVAKGLNNLTYFLTLAKDFDRAFNEGHEALTIYEALIVADSSVLSEYLRCLSLNAWACSKSDDHYKSLDRIMDVVQHSREIAKRFPVKPDEDSVLVRSIQQHSQILNTLNRPDDAISVTQEALDWYEKNPANTVKLVEQHLGCLIDIGYLLDNCGRTEKALNHITRAVEVGKPFADNAGVASMMLGAMHRRAQIFAELGRYTEALKTAQESLTFARTATLDTDVEFIGALTVLSMAYRYDRRPEDAIIAINEAIELCHSERSVAYIQTHPSFMLLLPQSLRHLALNLAIVGKEDEALPLAQKAVDILLDLKGKHIGLTWSDIEPTYMYSSYSLSLHLAANNNLPQALETMTKFLIYFEERSKFRNGAYTVFACGLLAVGILYCAAGRHEDGIAARTRFNDLFVRLRKELPTLAPLAQIEVEAETTSASWVALVTKLDLKCHHQEAALTAHKSKLAECWQWFSCLRP